MAASKQAAIRAAQALRDEYRREFPGRTCTKAMMRTVVQQLYNRLVPKLGADAVIEREAQRKRLEEQRSRDDAEGELKKRTEGGLSPAAHYAHYKKCNSPSTFKTGSPVDIHLKDSKAPGVFYGVRHHTIPKTLKFDDVSPPVDELKSKESDNDAVKSSVLYDFGAIRDEKKITFKVFSSYNDAEKFSHCECRGDNVAMKGVGGIKLDPYYGPSPKDPKDVDVSAHIDCMSGEAGKTATVKEWWGAIQENPRYIFPKSMNGQPFRSIVLQETLLHAAARHGRTDVLAAMLATFQNLCFWRVVLEYDFPNIETDTMPLSVSNESVVPKTPVKCSSSVSNTSSSCSCRSSSIKNQPTPVLAASSRRRLVLGPSSNKADPVSARNALSRLIASPRSPSSSSAPISPVSSEFQNPRRHCSDAMRHAIQNALFSFLNAKNKFDETALFMASWNGHLDMLRALLATTLIVVSIPSTRLECAGLNAFDVAARGVDTISRKSICDNIQLAISMSKDTGGYYVPLWRDRDGAVSTYVGEPVTAAALVDGSESKVGPWISPNSLSIDDGSNRTMRGIRSNIDEYSPRHTASDSTTTYIAALAGPISREFAIKLRDSWSTRVRNTPATPFSSSGEVSQLSAVIGGLTIKDDNTSTTEMKQRRATSGTPLSSHVSHLLVEKLRDAEKGYERVGRALCLELSKELNFAVAWEECWDFLSVSIDLSSPSGLLKLESYLSKNRDRDECRIFLIADEPCKLDLDVYHAVLSGHIDDRDDYRDGDIDGSRYPQVVEWLCRVRTALTMNNGGHNNPMNSPWQQCSPARLRDRLVKAGKTEPDILLLRPSSSISDRLALSPELSSPTIGSPIATRFALAQAYGSASSPRTIGVSPRTLTFN